MAWKDKSVMQERQEFVQLAMKQESNMRELCGRFGISRKTGYKWLKRYQGSPTSELSLQDQSRRPLRSPMHSAPELEQAVLSVRDRHRAWGGRKIAHVLARDQGLLIAPSTANSILKRHGRIGAQASEAAKPWQRFEHPQPNSLWQMDFKGHFALTNEQRCHALTVIDDHSRFNIVLQALRRQTGEVVQQALIQAFRRYGLPERINADNGSPWGVSQRVDNRMPLTTLGVWLIRLGVRLTHSRPMHPQTNGKDERFHRTLNEELIRGYALSDLAQVQSAFDEWRCVYNHQRPHESIQMQTPDQRYRLSQRSYPEHLPEIEYGSGELVRRVDKAGNFSFKGQAFRISSALAGYPVAIRPCAEQDGAWQVFFSHCAVAKIHLDLPDL